ncbi:MAG: hypothetical protein WKF84_10620 [Pyrinomonadaceae bacterium]
MRLIALRSAAPHVQRQLGIRLNMRKSPEVYFVRDTIEERALRVEALLQSWDLQLRTYQRTLIRRIIGKKGRSEHRTQPTVGVRCSSASLPHAQSGR